ncbi:Gfo/Idh/MocA family oxidoreductase [Aeoliella sp. ICT_H6.2]|uniref:Gfo/Idh/MocA family oxidoreductase n=1 Tax=Aeoliella straminimaris TaxID=2954799 RepID=A0A9X2F673_9BACT|nr:Gfo/Idh/MocA family oxidoreductase [Aeoliella straminimaris]MCO6042504.1 Gfo/Idh/MocA family oxidoreductase [Aeoliella straminimaris]
MSHRPYSRSRRDFLKATAAVGALGLAPCLARAASPNGKLRTAHIGVGGMGRADLNAISSHPQVEVAALCDVDSQRLDAALQQHTKAQTFADYRELIDQLGDKIDAVVVSTPDHTHAPAALKAMLAGKPVYCQKPLTHEVFEARRLREVADEKGLVTQMGVQIHSTSPYRRAVKMIQSGAIGKVSEVHAWSDKAWGFDASELPATAPVPETLDWDLWLGVADERPFVPGIYHPAQWRRMIDFGTGTLGDMGVHIFDTPYGALELTAPNWAKTTCRPPTGLGHPMKNLVEYEFPGTKYTTDTLTWKWYDGAFAPPADLEVPLAPEAKLPGQGSLFVGEQGMLLLPHVAEPVLLPQEKFADYQRPEVQEGNHYHQWVDACLGQGETSVPFSYAGPLTEALLLGVVAGRFPDTKLEWDAEALQVTNLEEANALLRHEYRQEFGGKNVS